MAGSVADIVERILAVRPGHVARVGIDGCCASGKTTPSRPRTRNQERCADPDAIEALYRERYVPGFALYASTVNPAKRASILYST